MKTVNELNPKKIAQLVKKNEEEVITINRIEKEYWIGISHKYYFKLKNNEYKIFKDKYNSYKNINTIPGININSSIIKFKGIWQDNGKGIFAGGIYDSISKKGYFIKGYKGCTIKINNDIIFNISEIGFIGIPGNILKYYPQECIKIFYNSKIYIYNNNYDLIGIVQSGDHKLYNKEIKNLTNSLQNKIENIDDLVVNDDLMINGIENVVR